MCAPYGFHRATSVEPIVDHRWREFRPRLVKYDRWILLAYSVLVVSFRLSTPPKPLSYRITLVSSPPQAEQKPQHRVSPLIV